MAWRGFKVLAMSDGFPAKTVGLQPQSMSSPFDDDNPFLMKDDEDGVIIPILGTPTESPLLDPSQWLGENARASFTDALDAIIRREDIDSLILGNHQRWFCSVRS